MACNFKLELKDYPFVPFKGIGDSSPLFHLHKDNVINGWLERAFTWMYSYHHEEAIFCFSRSLSFILDSCFFTHACNGTWETEILNAVKVCGKVNLGDMFTKNVTDVSLVNRIDWHSFKVC